MGGVTVDHTHHYDSPLGGITLAGCGGALTGLWFDGQRYFGDTLSPKREASPLPVFAEADRWLDLYFDGQVPDFTPRLELRGTPFRRAVWEILKTIPYGEIMTYGEIADRIAEQRGLPRMSARAVGAAVGRNPVSLIIPCHRVIGADGSLTGYAGGLNRKEQLLNMEKAVIAGIRP